MGLFEISRELQFGSATRVSYVNHKLALPWCLPSTCTKIKSRAAIAADLQYPPMEYMVESRNEALCAPANWQDRFSYG